MAKISLDYIKSLGVPNDNQTQASAPVSNSNEKVSLDYIKNLSEPSSNNNGVVKTTTPKNTTTTEINATPQRSAKQNELMKQVADEANARIKQNKVEQATKTRNEKGHKEDGKIDFVSNKTLDNAWADKIHSERDARNQLKEENKSTTTKLTKDEKKIAKNQVDNYFKNNEYARKLKNANNPNAAMALYNQLSDSQKDEYERMVALSNQLSKGSAFVAGAIDATPFAKRTETALQNKVNEGLGREGQYSYSDVSNMTQEQNPLSYLGGTMTSKAAQYLGLKELIPGLNATTPTSFLGQAVANPLPKALLVDTALDIGLDTIPTEVENYMNGMSAKDIATDTAKNIGTNYAFNVLGDLFDIAVNRKNLDAQNVISNNIKKSMSEGVVDNLDDESKALASQLRAENPLLFKDASDEDILNFVNAREQAKQEAQNYSNLYNVMNNTDDNVLPELMNNTDADTMLREAGIGGYIANDTSVINEFRASNPMITNGMSDDEVAELINNIYKGDTANTINTNLIDNRMAYAQNDLDAVESMAKNAEESSLPKNIADFDENKALEEAGLGDYTANDYINTNASQTEDVATQLINKKTDIDNQIEKVSQMIKNAKTKDEKTILEAARNDLKKQSKIISKRIDNNSVAKEMLNAKESEEIIPTFVDFISQEDEIAKLAEEQAQQNVKALPELSNPVAEKEIAQNKSLPINNTNTKQTVNSVSEIPSINKTEIPQSKVTTPTPSANPNAETGISKFYTNTIENTVDSNVKNKFYDENDFTYTKTSHKQLAQNAGDILNARGIESEYNRLMNLENWTAQDVANAGIIHNYLLKNGNNVEARNFARTIRPMMSTATAQALDAHKMFSLTTSEGALNEFMLNIDQAIDNKHLLKGYSATVDRTASKVKQAIENGNIDEAIKTVKGTLGDNAINSKAKTKLSKKAVKGANEIVDLLEKVRNQSLNAQKMQEIAEECEKIIRKNNGGNTITAREEVELLDIIKGVENLDENSREYKEAMAKVGDFVQNKMPSSFGNKLKSLLYANMLGNLRTALTRNAGGNTVSNALEKSQRPLRIALDKAIGAKTGTRNYTTTKGLIPEYLRGMGKGISEQAQDLRKGIQTTRTGESSLNHVIDVTKKAYKYDSDGKDVFKKAFSGGSKLDVMRKLGNKYSEYVTGIMQFGDRPFYEAEFATAKKELENIVRKFGDDAIQTAGTKDAVTTEELINFWAHERALEACYQNGTLTSEGFSALKKGLGKISEGTLGVDILSQSTSPFTQVPANMLERAFQYSPAGPIGNAVRTGAELATGNFNQKRFVDETSRNLTGLGLLGGAYGLARAGYTTGAYSDDEDKAKAQKNAGELEYAIKLPNGTQIDASDLPVLGGKIQSAAALNDAKKQLDNGEISKAEFLKIAATQDIDSAMGTSMMQGYNRLLGANNTYSKSEGIVNNAVDTVKSSGTQFIPSLLRQTAQTTDEYKRDLGEYGTNEYYANLMRNSIPGLRQELPIKLDNQGQPVLQNQGRGIGSKIAENYILPYTISQPTYSEIDTEANRLSDELGKDGNVAYTPNYDRTTARDVLGDSYSEEEYYRLRKDFGTLDTELGDEMLKSERYNSLTDDEKAKALAKLHSEVKQVIKMQNGGDSDNKIANYLIDGDTETAFKELYDSVENSTISKEYKNTLNEYGIKTVNNTTKAMVDHNDEQGLKDYKTVQDRIKKEGLEWKENYYDAYAEGGDAGLYKEIKYGRTAEQYGVPLDKNLRNAVDNYNEKQYANDYKAITSIEIGKDKYGEPEYASYSKELNKIYADNGRGTLGKNAVLRYLNQVDTLDEYGLSNTGSNREFIDSQYFNEANLDILQKVESAGNMEQKIVELKKHIDTLDDDEELAIIRAAGGTANKGSTSATLNYYYKK